MNEEARRATEDALAGTEAGPVDHVTLRRVLLAVAGVVDRHKSESDDDHHDTRRRVEGVNKLAVTIGSSVALLLITAIVTIWIR